LKRLGIDPDWAYYVTSVATGEDAARPGGKDRQAFLVELGVALDRLSDPMQIQAAASRMLGEHLAASRVLYSDVEAEGGRYYYFVRQDYHAPGQKSLVGRFLADDFGMALFYELRAGRVAVVTNVAVEPMLGDDERSAYRAAGMQAFIGVPLVRDGQPVAFMSVQQVVPRTWTAEEVALVEATAERTWAAVERARLTRRKPGRHP
jgi:GAF domain-containing protein